MIKNLQNFWKRIGPKKVIPINAVNRLSIRLINDLKIVKIFQREDYKNYKS